MWDPHFGGSAAFNASQYSSAQELLLAHQHWQAAKLQQALQGSQAAPPQAVLYKQFRAGWGNRLPGAVTGEPAQF